jgi:hypothetical protein
MAGNASALARLVALLDRPRWDLAEILTAPQLALVTDTSPTVACTGGRRGGKSFAAAVKGIDVCLAHAKVAAVYIAATRASAKRMVWAPLLELNRLYQLGGIPNRADLTLTFPNGSTFYVLAVDSEQAADKVRGIPNLWWAAVDEAQRYRREVLAYLLRDVLRAGQLDALTSGQQWLLGTPNPLGKSGAFWDRWSAPKTSRHAFTIFDNTKLGTRKQIEAAVEQILEEENQTKDSAWYRTEILAEWGAVDLEQRAYKFSDDLNLYEALPVLTRFLFCVDIGSTAADAIGVLGWTDDDPTIYLVEERIKRGQDDVELGNALSELDAKYDAILIVADAGGGGAKTVETIKHLHPELPIVAAEKPPVNVQVGVLNGVLKTGRFKAHPASAFSREVRVVGWVDGVVNGKLDESGVHSDIIPACRYGVIRAIPLLPELDRRTQAEREADAREKAEAAEHMRNLRAARRLRGSDPDDRYDDEADLIGSPVTSIFDADDE